MILFDIVPTNGQPPIMFSASLTDLKPFLRVINWIYEDKVRRGEEARYDAVGGPLIPRLTATIWPQHGVKERACRAQRKAIAILAGTIISILSVLAGMWFGRLRGL